MLYNPPAFVVSDIEVLYQQIEATGLAMLVTVGEAGPMISHVPMLLDRDGGRLIGHLARANAQIKSTQLALPSVAVFQGPDAYVSPGWYASKREHGKVVPTWNYAVIHVRGRLNFFDDRERLLAVVDQLTLLHEKRFTKPWSTADAPPDYIEAQLRGIVGFELVIEHIEGKHKLSQNRSVADQAGVVAGLGETDDVQAQLTAKLMAENLVK